MQAQKTDSIVTQYEWGFLLSCFLFFFLSFFTTLRIKSTNSNTVVLAKLIHNSVFAPLKKKTHESRSFSSRKKKSTVTVAQP